MKRHLFAYKTAAARRKAWPWLDETTIPTGQFYPSQGRQVVDTRLIYTRPTFTQDGETIEAGSESALFFTSVLTADDMSDDPAWFGVVDADGSRKWAAGVSEKDVAAIIEPDVGAY